MSQGDKESVEESKVLDSSMVDANDSGENDPHGEMSRGNVAQAVTQFQRGDDDDQDWDAVVLNHVLVHVLDKDQVEASATDDFTVFVIANGIDDVCLLITMSEDDFKLMGCGINLVSISRPSAHFKPSTRCTMSRSWTLCPRMMKICGFSIWETHCDALHDV